MTGFEVVRDPLWNNIRLDPEALAVIDTPAVQRLRYVRQLGHAFLVYPGATHSRFEHALGAYHLARRALAQLEDASDACLDGPERARHKLAALLHDIGHYPFSHALEEAGLPHHERLAERRLLHGELAEQLARLGAPAAELLALIQGRSKAPLAGLVSGSLDVDKLDYLSRDAWMCGVPYGVIDVDRLLTSLTVAPGADGRPTVALHEKGLASLESLLFAKYQMYRNVYWHHAVRSATAMSADDPGLVERVEDRLARDVGLEPGALFLDFPAKPDMLALDLPLVKRDGSVTHLAGAEAAAHLGLPRVAAELYRSARRLRVFVLGEARVEAKRIAELVMLPREAVAAWAG